MIVREIFPEPPLTVSSTSLGSVVTSRATTSVVRSSSHRTMVYVEGIHSDLKIALLWTITIRLSPVSLDNCIRQEKGYCRIQYKESSMTSPDPFQLDTSILDATLGTTTSTTAAGGLYPPTPTAVPCVLSYVTIPQGSEDGVTILNTLFSTIPFQSQWCGSSLGYTNKAFPMSVTCKFLSVY